MWTGQLALMFLRLDVPVRNTFSTNIMEIVSPLHEFDTLIHYLKEFEGYTENNGILSLHHDKFIRLHLLNPNVSNIVCLTKGVYKMYILQSINECSVWPVFGTHFSCLMNWVGADHCFSAYPFMTLMRSINVPSSRYVQPAHSGIFKIQQEIFDEIEYYELSVYEYLTYVNGWHCPSKITAQHICGQTFSCIHTARHTRDRGCMIVPFNQVHLNPFDPLGSLKVYANEWLGGPTSWSMQNGLQNFHRVIQYLPFQSINLVDLQIVYAVKQRADAWKIPHRIPRILALDGKQDICVCNISPIMPFYDVVDEQLFSIDGEFSHILDLADSAAAMFIDVYAVSPISWNCLHTTLATAATQMISLTEVNYGVMGVDYPFYVAVNTAHVNIRFDISTGTTSYQVFYVQTI